MEDADQIGQRLAAAVARLPVPARVAVRVITGGILIALLGLLIWVAWRTVAEQETYKSICFAVIALGSGWAHWRKTRRDILRKAINRSN